MDSQIFGLIVLASFFLFMLVALKIGKILNKKGSPPNLPPGPWKLPIIGHIHHLITSTPHRKLSDLAKIYGPLMHLQLGEISAIVVSSAEYAKEILKTHDVIFASRPKLLATEILKDRPSTFAIIARAVFGNKCKVQEFVSLENGESIAGGFVIAELFPSAKWLQRVSGYRPKLERFHRQIDQILENIIIEHKESKSKEGEGEVGEDLVDVLLKFQSVNIKAIILNIYGAGGRRICPGSTFGLINVEMALALMLYHFDWRLPDGIKGEDLDMTELFGATIKRKDDLYLIPTAYLPSVAI
ncbi:hypothetical protein P8452_06880 [Trifolium repens]|nr:hypothetical protein P8452_06880 [Trifolium repens]